MFDVFGAAAPNVSRDAFAVLRELAMVKDALATGGNFEYLYCYKGVK